MSDDPARRLLKVVRRQPVVVVGQERLEVLPGASGGLAEEGAIAFAERRLLLGDRAAETEGDEWRREPEERQRRRPREGGGSQERDERDRERAGERARRHLGEEDPDAALAHEARRARRARGGRLPLEQTSLRDEEPYQGDDHGVQGLPGVKREQRDRQHDARGGGREVLGERAQEGGDRARRPRTVQQRGERDPERRRGDPERGDRPDPRMSGQHGPAREQPGEEPRRREAPAQVVEDLEAADGGEAIARPALRRRHPRQEPEEDLPVAAHPPVLAPGVGEDARRVVVDDLDVGDQRGARMQPFEEIVRQQRVLGHPSFERGPERVDVVETLAGEDAFLEEVLVHVRDGGRVGVDAGVPGVEPGEE